MISAKNFFYSYGCRSFLPAILCFGAGCAGDGSGGQPESVCEKPAPGETIDLSEGEPCVRLSSYGLFAEPLGQLIPNAGVEPYDLATPLFTDGAIKSRHVRLPNGTSAEFREMGPMEFPVGSILVKSFGYPSVPGDPQSPVRWLETRLLVRQSDGWSPFPYVWNEAGNDAYYDPLGMELEIEATDESGDTQPISYRIPGANKCRGCHEVQQGTLGPIGPQAIHLNREIDTADGSENQLTRWSRLGLLGETPHPNEIPRGGALDDPDSASLDWRARTYLDINCAHCHNPEGAGRTSGLDLRLTQSDPESFGICKSPLSAARGIGTMDIDFDIVPGQPEDSLLFFRLSSTDPGVMMPELGRTIADPEGVELIREWIASMTGECEPY